MKKSLFSTALLAASFAFSSTFANAGEIADRVEKNQNLISRYRRHLCAVHFS